MTAKDIISRETLKRLTTDLARHLLGIDGEAVELLETQNQRVEDRRADLVARMRERSGAEFLLHVEIANSSWLGSDERRFRDYMTMLEILSENRDLKAQVREAQRMLTQVDIKQLPSYLIGFEDGEASGEARGELRTQALIARRLLRRLQAAEVAELLGMTAEEVERIAAGAGGDLQANG